MANKITQTGWKFVFIYTAVLCFSGSIDAVYAQTNETTCQTVIFNANAAFGGDLNAEKNLRRLAGEGNGLAQALESEVLATEHGYFMPHTNGFRQERNKYNNEALFYAKESADNGNSLGETTYGLWLRMLVQNFAFFTPPERDELNMRGNRFLKEGASGMESHLHGPCAGPYLYLLANKYAHGWEVEHNLHKSLSLMISAAKTDYVPAIGGVAAFYSQKNGVFFNPAKAAVWATRAADAGFLPGITLMGRLYSTGTGVKQSDKEAFDLYRKAANRGYPPAIYYASLAFFDGRGTPVQRERALMLMRHDLLYQPALRGLYFESLYVNIKFWERLPSFMAGVRNHSKIITMFKQFEKDNGLKPIQFKGGKPFKVGKNQKFNAIAEKGVPRAQFYLGLRYDYGHGIPINHSKADYWYRKAALQGFAKAQFKLGINYDHGQGVPTDYAKADYWFRKAALQGVAKAQYHLGINYYKGLGIQKSRRKAIYWLKKSAENIDEKAANLLRVILGNSG